MPFSFPASPSIGQTSLQNSREYVYVGGNVWELVAPPGSSLSGSVTIPGLGDPYYDNVSLLLHFNGNLTDTSASPKTVTAVGSAAATAAAKYGSTSLALDGNGDGLSISDGLPRGSENFTIEFWVYKNTAWTGDSSLRILYEWADNSAFLGVQCYLNNSNNTLIIGEYGGAAALITYAASNFSAATWYHMAVTRSGSDMTLWVNGTAVATGTYSGAFGSTPGIQSIGIGSYLGTFSANSSWPGRIDDFRVTRGVSRYASAFAPPTAAFADASGLTLPVTITGSGSDDPRWGYFTPTAPTGVTATASNAQAVVSWTAPANVLPPLTDYAVQFSTNGGTTWTTATDAASTATSATITGLTNGTAHVFRVAAINGFGTGAYSTQSSAVTPAAMATVTGGTVTTPGDGYRYHTFTTSGTLAISSSALTADVLVVGAGGAGGRNFGGGGGGGGGVLYQTSQSIAVGSYEVTVAPTAALGSAGTASSIGSLYSATGGAAGGTLVGSGYGANSGGSSGVPTSSSNSTANSGGSGVTDDGADSGGQGGGAGGTGVNGQGGTQVNSSNGRSVLGSVYGVGGRGGRNGEGTAFNGGTNTGNGGSGGGDGFSNSGRGTGGSGIVIVRYLVA
jgi:hypothetical protein